MISRELVLRILWVHKKPMTRKDIVDRATLYDSDGGPLYVDYSVRDTLRALRYALALFPNGPQLVKTRRRRDFTPSLNGCVFTYELSTYQFNLSDTCHLVKNKCRQKRALMNLHSPVTEPAE